MFRSKSQIASAILLVATIGATPASAGDLWGAREAGSIKDAPYVAPVVDWTGFYIGGQASYQWSGADVSWNYDLPGLGTGASLTTDGWMGGVHAGVQKQFGRWVLGVDLMGNWGDSSDSERGNWAAGPGIEQICIGRFCYDSGWEASGGESMRASIDRIFTVAGRLGYAWDNWLVYAKGGYAAAKFSTTARLDGEVEGCSIFGCAGVDWDAKGSTDKTHQGWTLGAGFAYMIARNVSLGLDYSYINLGSETHKGSLKGDVGVWIDDNYDSASFKLPYHVHVNPDDIHMLSARLTVHFNGTP
jgi:outer membrane immunogenic protein